MKLRAIAVILTATSFLAINTAFTGDCDIKHSEMISKLQESSEYINDADRENTHIPLLEEALKLCKEGKVKEGQKIINDINSQILSKHIEMKTQEGN
jgi:hypothetical protein